MFELKSSEYYLLTGKRLALISFLIGSIILGTYFVTQYNGIIYLALFFIITALLFNTLVAIILMYFFVKKPTIRKQIIYTILLMTVNIPIGLFYMNLGFAYYNKLVSP